MENLVSWKGIADDPLMARALMPGVCDGGDLVRARALVEKGCMTLLNGNVENLLPGIDVCKLKNCHSMADQLVVINTPDGPFVDVGDIATREARIVGVKSMASRIYYLWQSGGAGSQCLTMRAYKKIMELVGHDIKHVIMRHDFTYAETKEREFAEGPIIRYKLR